MKRFWKIFGVAYPVSFPFAFMFERHLEQTGNSDALGTWYTVYSALFWSFLLAAVLAFVFLGLLRLRQATHS